MNCLDNISASIPYSKIFFDELKVCKQNPKWHREGSAYDHTLMTLSEIEKILSENEFTENEANILRYVMALHDIGKPATSQVVDGEIKSIGHSKVGCHITNEILYHSNLPFETIRMISSLVRYHGWAGHIANKKDPEYFTIKLSHLLDTKLLYYITLADINGRISQDPNDLDEFLFNLEYYKELCENLYCFGKPYQFKSGHSKYMYFNKNNYYRDDLVYDDYKSNVYIMSGIPGSGKDYYIKNNFDIPVISMDNIRKELKTKPTDNQGHVIQEAFKRAKVLLRKNESFVFNATNTTKLTRNKLIKLFDVYKAKSNIIFIYKPINVILEQNNNRKDMVPEKVIYKLLRGLDIPESIESHVTKFH